MDEQRTDDWAERYGDRDLSNPDTIKRAAVEGVSGGAFEYLAGASNDPEGNATAFWLERRQMARGLISVETVPEDDWSDYHEFRKRTDPPPWGEGRDDNEEGD